MTACLLAWAALLPALVACERFLLGDCSRYQDKIDPIALTELGINMLKKLGRDGGLSVMFWDASDREASNSCIRLHYDLDLGYYQASYIDSTGARSRVKGRATFSTTPTPRIQLNSGSEGGRSKRNAPSACRDGRAALFPAYISNKELLLLGCCDHFIGRRETLYVLTTEDVTEFHQECARKTIMAATGRHVTAPNGHCADTGYGTATAGPTKGIFTPGGF